MNRFKRFYILDKQTLNVSLTSLRQYLLHDAHVLGSDAQNVRKDGQDVTDCVRFAPIDRQQVMYGRSGSEHANCVAELVHEF